MKKTRLDLLKKVERKGVKTMKGIMGLVLGVAIVLATATAYAATAPAVVAPQGYNTSTCSAWRVIHYETTTDAKGYVTGKSGYQTFGGVNLDNETFSGYTLLTFGMYGGAPQLTESFTHTDTKGSGGDGKTFERTDESTTKNTYNGSGAQTGGSVSSSYTQKNYDNAGALVSKTTGSSASTSTGMKNGQLCIYQTTGSSTTTDKDGKPIDSGTVTVNNTYGNYSGGQWNVTQSVQKTHNSSLPSGETFSDRTITTVMGYSQDGNLISQSASGTGSGKADAGNGVGIKSYTSTISQTWTVNFGVAYKPVYTESQIFAK